MFVIRARGHGNVRAMHETTLEISRENFLTPRGDCIIAISADKGLADLDEGIKKHLKSGDKITIEISCGDMKEKVIGYGDPRLTFKSKKSIIIRKSDFVCDRTLCIRADKSAADLNRELVKKIRTGADVCIYVAVV